MDAAPLNEKALHRVGQSVWSGVGIMLLSRLHAVANLKGRQEE